MRAWRYAASAALALAFTGCIYADVHQPLSYRSPTPGDVGGQLGPEVEGRACSRVVLWLVAWGDGGYRAAVENAKAKTGATLLADVQADTNFYNVLSVYQHSCTVVRGRTVK
ncbi:MAG TPA: TRL domain-containing protein [Methylomirabilota bacterium]|nr:TRL domain-containing protein [Methylomirabilota bacterium]